MPNNVLRKYDPDDGNILVYEQEKSNHTSIEEITYTVRRTITDTYDNPTSMKEEMSSFWKNIILLFATAMIISIVVVSIGLFIFLVRNGMEW